jgi:hypothetical protein
MSYPFGSSSGVSRAKVSVEMIMRIRIIYSNKEDVAILKHTFLIGLVLLKMKRELPVKTYLTSTYASDTFRSSFFFEWS